MKYQVIAEIRYSRDLGTFEADSPELAHAMAEETAYYRQLATNDKTAGIYDIRIVEVPAN
jgi:hypothetical protein